MIRAMLFMACTLSVMGCMPASIPQPYSVKAITYELDQDTQKWTERDCTTTTNNRERPNELQTVCYNKRIAAPPGGIGGPKP